MLSRTIKKDDSIIFWGVGALQTDLQGLYDFTNVKCYIDDYILERNLISVSREEISSSSFIRETSPKDVIFILCGDDQNEAISKLLKWGYSEYDYILGEELLINCNFYKRIEKKGILLWGIGDTYSQNRDIRLLYPNVKGFIDSHPFESSFDGLPLITPLDEEIIDSDNYIIVTSIYYNEIFKTLSGRGLTAGKDFISYKTAISIAEIFNRTNAKYQFIDRRKKSSKLLIVLAGYKELVWKNVFDRLKKYVPREFDICIVTSGLINFDLMKMCEENEWSYLSTEVNHVSLVTNLAILNHPDAQYIFKMDEDIFLTSDVFDVCLETYWKAENRYEIGFVSPLIPINGYGYVRLLEIFGSDLLWEEKFGDLKYTDCYCHHKIIHDSPDAAKFMWGEGNPNMNDIDIMNDRLKSMDFKYSVCPIRYSIGFILFHRNVWIKMNMLPVTKYFNMGSDEIYFCNFCMMQGRAMIISENSVVGHFNYGGGQTKAMENYYKEHIEKFIIKDN